jgi:hypothetical protein
MHTSLWPLATYLARMTRRMESRGFPPNHRLHAMARTAYDATCSLMTELHYVSCNGTGRAKRD